MKGPFDKGVSFYSREYSYNPCLATYVILGLLNIICGFVLLAAWIMVLISGFGKQGRACSMSEDYMNPLMGSILHALAIWIVVYLFLVFMLIKMLCMRMRDLYDAFFPPQKCIN